MRPAVALALIVAGAAAGAGCDRETERPPAALVASAPRTAAASAVPDPGFVGVVVTGEWVEVEARVEGRVQELLVRPGDRVAKGAPLARLDVTSTLHELAIARAALVEARRRYSRRRRLARGPSGAISAEEVDTARRELLQERARVQKLETARAEATVAAPFAGTVMERHLAAGALAGPGRPILRLLGEGEPQVRFAVPEEQAAAITAGARVEVRVGPRRLTVRGRVVGVAPEVDSSSRMVFASAALEQTSPPPQPLSTGLIARVFLPASGTD
jgi:RND family efflux transporter MFP subunit